MCVNLHSKAVFYMKKQYLFRVWETAALIALSLLMCSAAWAQGKHQQLNEHVLRLHVLAVSDEESEQQLKLRVRDNVLGYVETLLEEADNIQKAESIIEKNLNGIAKAAFEKIQEFSFNNIDSFKTSSE